ncbi:hypothetical protein F2P56_004488 [Juglans regia]|uniref:Late embryogenesis abundant protein LEA-2 subgroup domain-containing protein n=2 Tax=Juglans regia TaxID=51240 RepID=A0A834D5S0_JUGRE|nr:uncharacterized protein LOC109019960 [Juglans regia]KAF5477880.1 hypothetical protein F2P56_004488 [Juglans regia]
MVASGMFLPIKPPQAGKVHPCNINENDPRLQNLPPDGTPNIMSIGKYVLSLIAMLISFITICGIISTFAWFTFKSQDPTLRVDSLSLSTFDTSNSTLTAIYEVGLTFHNPNDVLKLDFEEMEVFVFYKRHYAFAGSTVEPFSMDVKETKSLNATLGKIGAHWIWEDSVVEEIRGDRKKGTVGFDFLIRETVIFKGPWWLWWKGKETVAHYCSNLEVLFVNAKDVGRLRKSVNGAPMRCHEVG